MKEETRPEQYMQRCLELASLGLGSTAPNPMVGSIIIHHGTIIGEGYHQVYGGPHAEVNAVNAVKDPGLLSQSTLYVNLEPCSHLGKTPPCADMIIRNGIPEVVIGTADPNPVVSGNGIRKLREAGVHVQYPVIPDACFRLNRRFFSHYLQQRPWVILKWAQTADGYIDVLRGPESVTQPTWISNEISRMMVHAWRSEEQAILVGTRTALLDNPQLTVREWPGRSPIRMLIDRNLTLPRSLHLFDNSVQTLVFNDLIENTDQLTHYIRLDFEADIIPQIFSVLHARGIQSLIVEGGYTLLNHFIRNGYWDEARVFQGKLRFGKGIRAPVIEGVTPEVQQIRQDLLMVYRRDNVFPEL